MKNRCINLRVGAVGRLVSAALVVIFAAASVHSTVFIFVHAGHSHADGDYDAACGVCAHLAAAGGLMKSFSPPVADAPVPAVFINPSDADPKIINPYNDVSTPVLLRVRLNN